MKHGEGATPRVGDDALRRRFACRHTAFETESAGPDYKPSTLLAFSRQIFAFASAEISISRYRSIWPTA